MHTDTQRRQFLSYFGTLGFSSSLFPRVLWGKLQDQGTPRVTAEALRDAAAVSGLMFSRRELEAMVDGVNENLTIRGAPRPPYRQQRRTPAVLQSGAAGHAD